MHLDEPHNNLKNRFVRHWFLCQHSSNETFKCLHINNSGQSVESLVLRYNVSFVDSWMINILLCITARRCQLLLKVHLYSSHTMTRKEYCSSYIKQSGSCNSPAFSHVSICEYVCMHACAFLHVCTCMHSNFCSQQWLRVLCVFEMMTGGGRVVDLLRPVTMFRFMSEWQETHTHPHQSLLQFITSPPAE